MSSTNLSQPGSVIKKPLTAEVAILYGVLLEQAERLLAKGIHAGRITNGFELASQCSVRNPVKTARRIVNECHEQMTRIAMDTRRELITNAKSERELLATKDVRRERQSAKDTRRDCITYQGDERELLT